MRIGFRLTEAVPQQIRRYAADSKSSSDNKGGNTFLYVAGAGAAGLAGYYFLVPGTPAAKKAEAKAKEAVSAAAAALPGAEVKKAFTGGEQGFLSLQLEEVETINHNTKRFRFKLPEEDQVSGLHVASALLTKFKPEGAEKAVLRPYTPISDESKHAI